MNIDLTILQNKEIKIIGHKNADFDSMTSGFLLEYIFKQLHITSKYILQDDCTDPYFTDKVKELGYHYNAVKEEILPEDHIFLVDHTDYYDANVVGCFDHHPVVYPVTVNYVCTNNTSCAKLIYDWGKGLHIDIPEDLTILTVYACYMDSLSFKSTKAKKEDHQWCKEMIDKYKLNEEEIIDFGYGLTDPSLSFDQQVLTGLKTYPYKDKKICASYIITKDNNQDLEKINKFLLTQLTEDITLWCFIVGNVKEGTTTMLLTTKDYHTIYTYNGALSRGKNIIPGILRYLEYSDSGEITNLLIEKKLEIATMESCTSGLIASTITDYEGSSAVVKGSFITYSNEYKVKAGVDQSIIDHYGVYSMNTARDMAKKTKAYHHSDISIGITGSFSNVDPNNADSVAGEVYFVINAIKEYPVKLIYHNLAVTRKAIKKKTVDIVLAVLYAYLK